MKKLDEEYKAKVKKLQEEHGIKEEDVKEQSGGDGRPGCAVGYVSECKKSPAKTKDSGYEYDSANSDSGAYGGGGGAYPSPILYG